MSAAVTTRLGLARALQGAHEAEAAAKAVDDTGAAIVAARRVKAVRAALLGRRAEGAEGIDVMDPEDAAARALAHLQQLKNDGAPPERIIEDRLILQPVLRFAASVAKTAKLNEAKVSAAANAMAVNTGMDEFREIQLARFTSASTVIEPLKAELAEASSVYQAAVRAEDERMATLNDERKAALNALSERMKPGQPGGSTYDDYYEAHRELVGELQDQMTVAKMGRQANLARADAGLREAATKVISAFQEASPVTEAEATAWAARQEISKQAVTRLKKTGYTAEQVRADMAEFYRLSGGRLGSVKINTNGSTRANATGIHGHGSAVINIDGDFDRRTLWHENGHHLEADPSVLAAAKAFLRKRSDGTGLHTLRSLTGNTSYRSNEKAYRDHFFSHYVGKHYSDATEVMSMAMESLSDPTLLGQRLAQDPEIFKLLEGIMKTPVNKLMHLMHDVREKNASVQAEFVEAQADARGPLLKAVASKVDISAQMPDVNPAALQTVTGWYARVYKLGDFVGAHINGTTAYLVYKAAKVTEYLSAFEKSRPKKGYLIAAVSVADTPDLIGSSTVNRCGVVGDMDEVRSRIVDWIAVGRPPVKSLTVKELKSYAER